MSKLLIDLSKYKSITTAQWDIFGLILDGVIIRLGYGVTEDEKAAKHVADARRVGLPVGGYFWADPTWDFDRQIAKYREVVVKYKPACMFNDAEQFWRDWTAFMARDMATAYATRFSAAELNTFYKRFYDATKGMLPTGIYTRDSFMTEYSPQMTEWVVPANYWAARFVKNTHVYKPTEVKAYAETLDIGQGIGRQFAGVGGGVTPLNVTGLPSIDWNIFTDAGFNVMFKNAVPTVPGEIMDTNATVTATLLNVRTSPEVTLFNKVRQDGRTVQFVKDQRITVDGVTDNFWYRVSYPVVGYVSGGFVDLDIITPPVEDNKAVLDELYLVKGFVDGRIAAVE